MANLNYKAGLLAGPILRRVDSSGVSVWFAFRYPVRADIQVYQLEDDNIKRDFYCLECKEIGAGSAVSISLGKNLHIVLVTARPYGSETQINPQKDNETNKTRKRDSSQLFPAGKLLAYDIKIKIPSQVGPGSDVMLIDNQQEITLGLDDFGLLSGNDSILYSDINKAKNVRLPTFFIPLKVAPLNVLYGSCRKLHGHGGDSLVAADRIISENFNDLKTRPSALFLTGDQVYADDVADSLITHISNFGNDLLGWIEKLDGLETPPCELKVGSRQSIINTKAKFTAEHAGNHLLAFGEFAAAYLLAWNIHNWPDSYPPAEIVEKSKRRKYQNDLKQLKEEIQVLPAIRRILANIPTYMLCDDHEVTDDWNITMEWTENVKNSTIGSQIIANALATYWAFQGWGNDPDRFDEKFISGITNYIKKGPDITGQDRKEFQEQMLNFHSWSYIVPLNPLVVVLDSRTQRHYDTLAGPPQLVNDKALSYLKEMVETSGFERGYPLVIVTPTPVIGFEYAERIQQFLAKKFGVYKLDLETWSANVNGWVKFLAFLTLDISPSTCIFLSGDVHYAFAIRGAFYVRQSAKKDDYNKMEIVQLNSSALKTTSIVKIALLSEILGRIRQISPVKFRAKLGWTSNSVENGGRSTQVEETSTDSLSLSSLSFLHPYRNGSDSSPLGRKIARILNRKKKNILEMIEREGNPDWIVLKTMVNASGDLLPLVVISDNNLGLAAFSKLPLSSTLQTTDNENSLDIEHRLYVRKKSAHYDKVHRSIIRIR